MAGKAHISGAMVDVLALLLQAWEDGTDVHGLMIMRSVRRSGPAVYKVLDRLEDRGWIDSHWEVLEPGEKRPRRRYYRLSASGAESASALFVSGGRGGGRREQAVQGVVE